MKIKELEKSKNAKNKILASITIQYKQFRFLQNEIESDINHLKNYNLTK